MTYFTWPLTQKRLRSVCLLWLTLTLQQSKVSTCLVCDDLQLFVFHSSNFLPQTLAVITVTSVLDRQWHTQGGNSLLSGCHIAENELGRVLKWLWVLSGPSETSELLVFKNNYMVCSSLQPIASQLQWRLKVAATIAWCIHYVKPYFRLAAVFSSWTSSSSGPPPSVPEERLGIGGTGFLWSVCPLCLRTFSVKALMATQSADPNQWPDVILSSYVTGLLMLGRCFLYASSLKPLQIPVS